MAAVPPDAVGNRGHALKMRAEVISGVAPPRLIANMPSACQWDVGPRTTEELLEGAKCYQAAAKAFPEANYISMRRGLVTASGACFKQAQGR